MRQRDRREAQALAFLRNRPCASALEIGAAAVDGEPWAASRKTWPAKAGIGLSMAVAFTKRGIVRPTRENKFTVV